MKLEKLLHMGPSELAYRSWQEAAKQFDRFSVATAVNGQRSPRVFKQLRRDAALEEVLTSVWQHNPAAAAEKLLERFRDIGGDRFFAGAVDDRAAHRIAGRSPWTREQTIVTAESLCLKRFDLLGYRALYFGDPIDWQLDPVSGFRAPLVHWSQIDPLDYAQVGDSKVTWELNRHQWLVDLGQAYRHTRDERYAHVLVKEIRDWMQANPPGMGINWASSLEVAFRLISWCWALFLFRSSTAITPEFFARMLGWIGTHASHVERYLSYYFSPNTHLTGEALGLFYVGVVFPELRGAERWRTLGQQILLKELDRQVLPDGVYFEQSTYYQRYTAEIYLHFLILAARNAIDVPASVAERVQRVLDFLLTLRRPDGTVTQIGDADGGWLLPLERRAANDIRGIFAVAAAFFGRADYAWAAQTAAPEMCWLLGVDGANVFEVMQPAPPAMAPSRLLPHGGYAVMRSSWDRHAHQMIFDVGPLGCPVSGAHGHADLLGIQCDVFGKPFLVDAGTYCYTAETRWRDHFRSSAAHSTVTVDEQSQAAAAGPFSWRERPQARLRRWISNDSFDLADGEHDAYAKLADPVRHRRRVFFYKPRYWVLVDELQGETEHRIDLRFQFAPLQLTLCRDQWVRARGTEDCELLLRAFAAVPLQLEVLEGKLDPIQGWVSADYGQREPAPVLHYSTVTQLPLHIVTLMLPARGASVAIPSITPMTAGGRFHLIFEDTREMVCIDEHDIVVERAPDTPAGNSKKQGSRRKSGAAKQQAG